MCDKLFEIENFARQTSDTGWPRVPISVDESEVDLWREPLW